MSEDPKVQASTAVAVVRGETIWSAVAGAKDDYVLTIEVGEKLRRKSRLMNPKLSFNKRTFEGAMGFVIECPWRIDAPDKVLVSCFELLESNVSGPHEIPGLEDARVQSVEITGPALDLVVHLTGGLRVLAFSAEASPRKKRNNWTFWSQRHLLTVGAKGAVTVRDRVADEAAEREKAAARDIDDVVIRLPFRKPEETK